MNIIQSTVFVLIQQRLHVIPSIKPHTILSSKQKAIHSYPMGLSLRQPIRQKTYHSHLPINQAVLSSTQFLKFLRRAKKTNAPVFLWCVWAFKTCVVIRALVLFGPPPARIRNGGRRIKRMSGVPGIQLKKKRNAFPRHRGSWTSTD